MLYLIKQIILYIYIVCTKFKQRRVVIEKLKCAFRPQRDVAFDRPGLPDSVDDIHGVPDGWSEVHSISAFDRDGTCIQCSITNGLYERKELCVHIPSVGTLVYSESDQDCLVEDGETSTTPKKRLITDMVDPMQTWKIAYRGHMNVEQPGVDRKRTHFVRVHLYWKGTEDPYDFWLDTPPWQLSGGCSNLELTDALSLLSSKSIWYEQWGELRGSMTVDDIQYKIRMPALRERQFMISDNTFGNRTAFVKSQIIEIEHIAHRFSYKTVTYSNGKQLQFGHVLFPSLESYYSSKEELEEGRSTVATFKLNFCGREVEVTERKDRRVTLTDNQQITYNKYNIDGNHATGLVIITNRNCLARTNMQTQQKTLTNDVANKDDGVLLVDLSDARCRSTNLVGGKAANLSALLHFGYNVPPAFCVTTNAFKRFLDDNPELAMSIENIECSIREMKLEGLKEACDKVVECLPKCNINTQLITDIDEKLQEITSHDTKRVAVRSSAIGEDGNILSAAGQLETILGVQTSDMALEALKRCWSSYFSFQSVEYRRQNGQVIFDGMGVIIQQMVHSEVSGVLMTNDPLTGREDRLLINACLGLGEGVVAGQVESDTYVIGVNDSGAFSIEKMNIGCKSKRVELTATCGTYIREGSSYNEPCLSKGFIYHLCSVGKSIEMKFKLEQEIEWAVCNDSLYILQARPITALDEETDDDVFHEFDTPAVSEREIYTSCNIQEMMPGAATPLTASYFNNITTEGFLYVYAHTGHGAKRVHHPLGFVASCGNKYFLNMSPLYVMAFNSIGGMKSKAFLEIDLLGEEQTDVSIDDIMNYKGTKLNTMWKTFKCFVKRTFFTNVKFDRDFLKWEGRMHEYTIGKDTDDASRLFQHISEDRTNLFDVCKIYLHMTNNPYASIVKVILMGGSPMFTRENKEDLSNLLIKCGTVSSDVPKAITKLANEIKMSGISDEFVALTDEESLTIIKRNGNLNHIFEDFMKQHGHRGIREAEFMEKSWSQDPVKLIKALKSILKNGIADRKDEDTNDSKIADILNNMKSEVSPFKRWLLKTYLLEKLLTTVLDRERGKSLIIKVIGAFKIAYWSLANLMVKEGRLPDENLLFFLTHREIGELLDTRCPKLIRKAKHRMKVFPRQQSTHYEQFSFGSPKRIEKQANTHACQLGMSVVLEGMPVGNGEATGRVCIVTKEEDVSNIKKGDILICQYTDIGWSPYFPLIGGLVTEIGSILSHGAVVARECGIPCVVNVRNATSLLKSDEIVRINGNKGTVQRLLPVINT